MKLKFKLVENFDMLNERMSPTKAMQIIVALLKYANPSGDFDKYLATVEKEDENGKKRNTPLYHLHHKGDHNDNSFKNLYIMKTVDHYHEKTKDYQREEEPLCVGDYIEKFITRIETDEDQGK